MSKHAGGRPPKYKTAEELAAKCEEYFAECDKNVSIVTRINKKKEKTTIEIPDPIPYTVPGLSLYLGYATRFSIQDLKVNKKFSHIIKRALTRIEDQRLVGGLTRQRSEPVSIFDLKSNFGYREIQEVEISGPKGGPIQLSAIPPTPQAIALWEQQVIESRKALQANKPKEIDVTPDK